MRMRHKCALKWILIIIPFVGIIYVLKDGVHFLQQQPFFNVQTLKTSTPQQGVALPRIYIVTPTYQRATQMADLTRMAQTLMLVPEIYWIIVEDADGPSTGVHELLSRTSFPHVQLVSRTPRDRREKKHGKGVSARRKAMTWLRNNTQEGVLYFGDDDNAYDIRIFEEMRWTKKVSVWPVGLIYKYGVSSPVVQNGQVVAFHDAAIMNRRFAMDMAGFAVNLRLFLERPNATMNYRLGHLEDDFLKGLDIGLLDLEPQANNCTEVMVWHTKTQPASSVSRKYMKMAWNVNQTNIPQLYAHLLS